MHRVPSRPSTTALVATPLGRREDSVSDPPLHNVDLAVRERMRTDEVAVARLRLPRWHRARLRHPRDLRRVLLRRSIGEEAEGAGTVRVMALRTVLEHDRRNGARERHRAGGDEFADRRYERERQAERERRARHDTGSVPFWPDRDKLVVSESRIGVADIALSEFSAWTNGFL